MLVAGARPSAHERGALLLEARGQLVHSVAEVVSVAHLVAHAEDRHLLALEIERRQVAVQLRSSSAPVCQVGAPTIKLSHALMFSTSASPTRSTMKLCTTSAAAISTSSGLLTQT